ncbi:MAG: L-2-amino-thiazoline-4-carboxylic acid hydrolase [Desulfovibrionaceae bacterium]
MTSRMTGSMTLLERRRIEAGTLERVYAVLCAREGEAAALASLEAILGAMAVDAGRAFAAQAPDGPSFAHFATVVDLWQGTGALDIRNMHATDTTLTFEVHRCAYANLYREMGMPQQLVERLSCNRDGPFARGYSPHIRFVRTHTVAGGGPFCDFSFTWEA